MCGDCRETSQVDTLVDGQSVNVAFTSPPYASQRRYDKESGFEPIRPDGYVDWFEAVQANVRRCLAPDGSWFVNIKEHAEGGERDLYVKDLVIAHKRLWRWMFVDELIWRHKGLPGRWPNRFKNAFEPVFQFSQQKEIRFNPKSVGAPSNLCFNGAKNGGRVGAKGGSDGYIGFNGVDVGEKAGLALPGNVIDIRNLPTERKGAKLHGASFPIGLPRFFVKAYSHASDIIYDPFIGSGTTGVAAELEGRICYGMELSPAYVGLTLQRLSDMGLAPVLLRQEPTDE